MQLITAKYNNQSGIPQLHQIGGQVLVSAWKGFSRHQVVSAYRVTRTRGDSAPQPIIYLAKLFATLTKTGQSVVAT